MLHRDIDSTHVKYRRRLAPISAVAHLRMRFGAHGIHVLRQARLLLASLCNTPIHAVRTIGRGARRDVGNRRDAFGWRTQRYVYSRRGHIISSYERPPNPSFRSLQFALFAEHESHLRQTRLRLGVCFQASVSQTMNIRPVSFVSTSLSVIMK